MRKGVNLCVSLLVDSTKTSQSIDSINVHGTATADTLSATSSEGKGAVHFVLNFNKGIQNHGTTGIQVDLVCLQVRLLGRFIRVL